MRSVPGVGGRNAAPAFAKRRTWLVSGCVSLVLIVVLLLPADGGAIVRLLGQLDPIHLSGAVILLAMTNVFHAERLAVLIGDRVATDWWSRMALTLRYGLYVAVLPARLGEVAYVLRLRRDLGLRPSEGIALTAQQRLLDIVVLGSLTVVTGAALASPDRSGAPIVLLGVGLATSAAMTVFHLPALLGVLIRVLRSCAWVDTPRWRAFLVGTIRGRRWMRATGQRADVSRLAAFTVAEWAANIAAIALVVAAAGVRLSVVAFVTVAVAVVLSSALPLQAVGGIGVAELAMTGILLSFGVELDVAVTSALVMRSLLLGVPLLLWTATLLRQDEERWVRK